MDADDILSGRVPFRADHFTIREQRLSVELGDQIITIVQAHRTHPDTEKPKRMTLTLDDFRAIAKIVQRERPVADNDP